jgi:hypothetical protein
MAEPNNTAETSNSIFEALDQFNASLWACLPEETANDIAKFKRDVLTGIKSCVDTLIDENIKSMERHLEMARKIREEDDRAYGATEAPPEDAAPNPA